jgi:CelD/BcsL family acetyltransferase involved in cellulose biosynthesis
MDAANASLAYSDLDSGEDACSPKEDASPVQVSVRAGSAPDAIERLRSEWTALAANASEPNAFAEHWFLAASVAHLDTPADLRIAEVWEGQSPNRRLIGLVPIYIERRYGRMPVAHVENWAHFHSFLGTPLIRAGREQAFWTGILRFLDGQRWASGFVHLDCLVEDGPVHRGLADAARAVGRPCDVVHRSERALLQSDLDPQAYHEATVRKKKRKELKRLQSRLAELGRVETRTLAGAAELEPWCDEFLALESSGWKGSEGAGSALGCSPSTERFFRDAVAGAFNAGKLDFLRLDLDGRPLAMLVNFLTPPGSFSFKIAIDEEHARYSPGVLVQLENLRILARPELDWMDSCASENHPMINSLWGERRPLVRVTVPLSGPRRRTLFTLCRLAENASASLRRILRKPSPKTETSDND